MEKKNKIDDEIYIGIIAEEITNFLVEKNYEMVKLIKVDRFEEAEVINEELKCFINETAKILQKEVGGSLQKLYNHFHQQNQLIYQTLIKKIL